MGSVTTLVLDLGTSHHQILILGLRTDMARIGLDQRFKAFHIKSICSRTYAWAECQQEQVALFFCRESSDDLAVY
jgi:hypothetical protein